MSILSKIVMLINDGRLTAFGRFENVIYFKLECKGCLINIVYDENFLFRIHFAAVHICLSKVFESCNSSRRYPLEFLKASIYMVYYWTRRCWTIVVSEKNQPPIWLFFHLKLASCTMHSKTVYFNLFFTAVPYF